MEAVNGFLLHVRRIDWVLVALAAALWGFGLLVLRSLAEGVEAEKIFFWRQAVYGLAGITLAVGISFLNVRMLQKHGTALLALYAASALAIGGLFVFGDMVRGVRAWYGIGAFGVAPAEFAKIILIALLAKFFSDRHRNLYTARHILISFLYAAGLGVLVALEPDAGSALVFLALWLGITLFTGIRFRWIAVMACIGVVGAVLAWYGGALAPYQKERIRSFLDPAREMRGAGYNALQSRVAVGSGGLWGKGFGNGTQGSGRFLPEARTDFAFAVVAEEQGLAGVGALLIAFLLFWWRLIRVGSYAMHNFGRIFIFGFSLLTAIQFFLNIGMNMGLAPVVGIPLPFVSYGGSHLTAEFFGLGMVLAIAAQPRRTFSESRTLA